MALIVVFGQELEQNRLRGPISALGYETPSRSAYVLYVIQFINYIILYYNPGHCFAVEPLHVPSTRLIVSRYGYLDMQTRRSLLATVSGLSFMSIAGCLAGDDSNDSKEGYEDALALLEENKKSLDEFAEAEETPDSFNEQDIKRRADAVDEKLDEAEKGAADEDQAIIDNARSIADYQREAAEYNSLFVEFNNCFDTVDAYMTAERFEAANDELDHCKEVFGDIQDQFEDVEGAYSDIDQDLVTENAKLNYDRLGDNLQVTGEELEALDRFLDGFDQFLDGADVIFKALDNFENEEFDAAEPKFKTAESKFEKSEETLALLEADPNTPEQFKPDIIEFHCYTEAFYEASGYYADSAAAAADRNWDEAEELATKADEALNQCG